MVSLSTQRQVIIQHPVTNMDFETSEILVILQEECAEVIVELSKCFRFGPDQCLENGEVSNIMRLQKELGDLAAMVELLVDKNVGVTNEQMLIAKHEKFEKLKRWSNIRINK